MTDTPLRPSSRAPSSRVPASSPARVLHPARALLHPLWLAALALLLVNDHALKGAGILPGVLTGKLSDLAGLFLAPALLAALVRARRPGAVGLAHAAVGLVFAAIKTSPWAAGALEDLMALGPLPWHITVDPTDLVALPMLAASWLFVKRLSDRPRVAHTAGFAGIARRALTAAAAGVGVLGALATSPPPEPGPPTMGFPTVFTDLVVGTRTDTLILRVRPLKDSVWLDCATLLRSPSTALTEELFAPAAVWMIDPGRVVPLLGNGVAAPEGGCFAALVDGTLHGAVTDAASGLPIPRALVAWSARDFPPTTLSTSLLEVGFGRALEVVRTADGRAAWAPHDALFPAPLPDEEPAPAECALAPEGGVVDWQTPVPLGTQTITDITVGPDGCARLDLAEGEVPRPWYVCTGGVALPFAVGDVVHLSQPMVGEHFLPVAAVQLLGTDAATGKRLVVARGADLATWGEGDWTARDRPGCRPVHGACGSLVVPLDVTPTGVADGTLTILRAERIPIGDGDCEPYATGAGGQVFESVYVEPPTTRIEE